MNVLAPPIESQSAVKRSALRNSFHVCFVLSQKRRLLQVYVFAANYSSIYLILPESVDVLNKTLKGLFIV